MMLISFSVMLPIVFSCETPDFFKSKRDIEFAGNKRYVGDIGPYQVELISV